jgi:hypothetical protein
MTLATATSHAATAPTLRKPRSSMSVLRFTRQDRIKDLDERAGGGVGL